MSDDKDAHTPERAGRSFPFATILMVMLTIAAIVLLGVLWAAQWSVVHIAESEPATIPEARRALLATPLFWLGIALIAALWVAIWSRRRWRYRAIPIAAGIGALVLAGVFFWRMQTVDQPVTIATYQCTPGSNPFGLHGDEVLAGCEPAPMNTAVTLGTADERDMFTAEADGPELVFDGPPVGRYAVALTTTAPPETASIVLAYDAALGITAIETLDVDDPFAVEDRTWSTDVTVREARDAFRLLYYLSPEPALPDASLTFDVRQCDDTSPAAFDPSGCHPMPLDGTILQPVRTEPGPDTFRQPILSQQDATVTYTNLEARTYTFTPFIRNTYTSVNNYDFLVLPADGPQKAGEDVLTISQDSLLEVFSVEATPDSGNQAFIIYVFPTERDIYAAAEADGTAP